jgi:hypothetical protein
MTLSEQVGCVRAQVESPQGRKPLGTQRQKSDFRSSFCRFASPRLVPADLEPKTDPERSEGARPEENDDYYFYLYKKKRRTIVIDTSLFLLKINIFIGH